MSASGLPVDPGLALILDLDGVVVDSMPVHTLAWRRYLEGFGIQREDIASLMHGRRNDEIIREFLPWVATPAGILAHGAAKERLYRQMIAPELAARLVPGVALFLERAKGVPVALATNAERANADFILDGANLRVCFRVMVDGSQVERPKPAPDVYLLAARGLGIEPRNAIVFEDSPVGVEAARAAGMRVAGIGTHADSLKNVDVMVRDFLDPVLESWLAKQRSI